MAITRNKQHAIRAILILVTLVSLLTLSLSTTYAWLINQGYSDPYSNEYTVYDGTLYGDYNSGNNHYGSYSSFHWSVNGVNWMQSHRTSNVSFGNNHPAIVWHSFQKNSQNCDYLTAVDWANTDLPNAARGFSCSNHEIRVWANDPNDLITNVNYSVQVDFTYGSGSGGELTHDTYWLNEWNGPTGNGSASNGGKGYMTKI